MVCSPVRALMTGISLLALMNGCAAKPTRAPEIRTITSVGASPEAVVAGVPGASRNSLSLQDDRPVRSQERISGRVVDDRGRPMPNIQVRLADGSANVGRDVLATTDDAGGFTLSGVRPGRRYTLIAESDQGKHWYFGRLRDVEAPERSVEIEVHDQTPSRSSKRVGHVTEANPEEESEPASPAPTQASTKRSKANEEDLPPARPADDLRSPNPLPVRVYPGNGGWQSAGGQASFSPPPQKYSDFGSETVLTGAEAPLRDIEQENPLPPAREAPVGTKAAQSSNSSNSDQPHKSELSPAGTTVDEPFTSGSGPLITEFGAPAADHSGTIASEPTPAGPVIESTKPQTEMPASPVNPGSPSQDFATPAPVQPTPINAPPDIPASPLGFPASSSPAPQPPTTAQGPEILPEAEQERSEPASRTTWSDLALAIEPESTATLVEVPLASGSGYPRSTRRTGQHFTHADLTPEQKEPATSPAIVDRSEARAPLRDPAPVTASCNFDSRRKRLVDFEIPNLEGQPIKFSEIDADYILLDFWGSWCGPCIKTIPHLVELQKQYDPSRFRVVGISYETGPMEDRLPAVLAATKSLGINYPVLMGEANGRPCPLAEALHVGSYPTMVLVDRHGRILWRDTGASPPTLQRLDRVVASRVRNPTSGETVRR